ncbi:hypothetical protein Tco_0140840 [Tanacetum coccineum]
MYNDSISTHPLTIAKTEGAGTSRERAEGRERAESTVEADVGDGGGDDRPLHSQFDLTPHMQSDLWPKISKGIEQRLAKIYTDNKSTLKKEHWVLNSDRMLDAKSMVICLQGSRSLVVLRDMQMESSETREYPSQIQTYFDTHTVDGVFLRDEERLLYDLGPITPTGVPYTDDEIIAMVCQGKQRGHIPGVGRFLAGQGRDVLTIPEPRCAHTADVNEVKKENKQLRKKINMMMKVVRSDDKMSQLLTQLQSQHEVVVAAGVAGAGMMSRVRMRTPTRMRIPTGMRIVMTSYI